MNCIDAMLLATNDYTKKGMVIHPLSNPKDNGKSPGKRPLLDEWQKLQHTPDNISEYIAKGGNIGLVCGRASGITIIDLDHELFVSELFNGFEIDTLRSARTQGRGHIYLKYNPELPASKHHDLGIEILNDGSNAVIPPSIHVSGDVYRWIKPDAPIIEMPKELEKRILRLFQIETELKQIIAKCRHCFRDVIKRKPDMHGAEGREYMLVVCTDLKANGATEEHIKMFAKLMYGKEYNEKRTLQEWGNIDPAKTWQCENLRAKLPAYVDLSQCEECDQRRADFKKTETIESSENALTLKEILNLRNTQESRKLTVSIPDDHFISNFQTWISSTTDAYPDYSIVCALSLLSAACKGRVYLSLKQEKIKTNIWAFILGNSTTSRKSTVINKTQAILNAAFTINEGPESYSYEGYIEYLSTHPIAFFARDEVAGLLCEYEKKYMAGVVDVECSLYDGKQFSRTLAHGRSKELREYKISNPYIVKLYSTTPDSFARYTKLEDLTSGWLFRFLFVSPNYKKPFMPLDIETQENIEAWGHVLTHLKRIHAVVEMNGEIKFKIEHEALRFIQKTQQELEESAASENNQIYSAAIGRAVPYAFKIAMLLELGKQEPSFEISMHSMVQAYRMVVEYFIPTLLDVAERLEEDIRRNEISKVVYFLNRKNGVATHSSLLHDTKMLARVFRECIDTLLESQQIERIPQKDSKIICNYSDTFFSVMPVNTIE